MGTGPFEPGDDEHNVHFVVPPEHEAGAYAHAFAVWHTPYDFTIDFAASQLPEGADPAGDAGTIETLRVVARVRIPAGTVFALLRAINANMTAYEARWGEIRPPQPRNEGG